MYIVATVLQIITYGTIKKLVSIQKLYCFVFIYYTEDNLVSNSYTYQHVVTKPLLNPYVD
jgi:uncharacterized protein Veg